MILFVNETFLLLNLFLKNAFVYFYSSECGKVLFGNFNYARKSRYHPSAPTPKDLFDLRVLSRIYSNIFFGVESLKYATLTIIHYFLYSFMIEKKNSKEYITNCIIAKKKFYLSWIYVISTFTKRKNCLMTRPAFDRGIKNS